MSIHSLLSNQATLNAISSFTVNNAGVANFTIQMPSGLQIPLQYEINIIGGSLVILQLIGNSLLTFTNLAAADLPVAPNFTITLTSVLTDLTYNPEAPDQSSVAFMDQSSGYGGNGVLTIATTGAMTGIIYLQNVGYAVGDNYNISIPPHFIYRMG